MPGKHDRLHGIETTYRRTQSRLNYLYVQQGLSRFVKGNSPWDDKITELELELFNLRALYPHLGMTRNSRRKESRRIDVTTSNTTGIQASNSPASSLNRGPELVATGGMGRGWFCVAIGVWLIVLGTGLLGMMFVGIGVWRMVRG